MKLTELGEVRIAVTATDNPDVMQVEVGAERRKEVVKMVTNKDETVDQLSTRLRGMFRALFNTEARKKEVEQVQAAAAKPPTWEEDKAKLTKGK